jgi:hypothetical protein
MHTEADLLHSVGEIRHGANRSGAKLAISHPSPLQDIKGILTLVKEKTSLMRLNCHAQEVVKLAQILHSKLLLKRVDNPLEQLRTRGSQNNVINVEEVGNPISMVIYEQRSI